MFADRFWLEEGNISFTGVSLDRQTCKTLDELLLLDIIHIGFCLMNEGFFAVLYLLGAASGLVYVDLGIGSGPRGEPSTIISTFFHFHPLAGAV